jgi:hypothetical protein
MIAKSGRNVKTSSRINFGLSGCMIVYPSAACPSARTSDGNQSKIRAKSQVELYQEIKFKSLQRDKKIPWRRHIGILWKFRFILPSRRLEVIRGRAISDLASLFDNLIGFILDGFKWGEYQKRKPRPSNLGFSFALIPNSLYCCLEMIVTITTAGLVPLFSAQWVPTSLKLSPA